MKLDEKTSLGCVLVSLVILHCTAQPNLHCPNSVGIGDSAVLKCEKIDISLNILNPVAKQSAVCVGLLCDIKDERVNITFVDNSTVLITIHGVTKKDEGEWTCQSGQSERCSLNVYKLPSCEISSNSSTNDLSLGQDLPLTINLTHYFCTSSIVWNLTIGEQSQNVTGFQDREGTDDIISRIVTYSPTVTSSLTGHVELTFNCNDETYDVSCSGVEKLPLRGLQTGSGSVQTVAIIITVIILVIAIPIAIGISIFCWKKHRSTKKDDSYSDVRDFVPQCNNGLNVTGNDTEVSDVTGSLERNHFEPSDVNDNQKRALFDTGDVKGSQKELTEFREVANRKGNSLDKSRSRSDCQMFPNLAHENVDDSRFKLKQNRTETI